MEVSDTAGDDDDRNLARWQDRLMERVARQAAPLIIGGIGQFEVEVASDTEVFVRMPVGVTQQFTGGANLRTFVRLIGFGQGSELPCLAQDRVWIQ